MYIIIKMECNDLGKRTISTKLLPNKSKNSTNPMKITTKTASTYVFNVNTMISKIRIFSKRTNHHRHRRVDGHYVHTKCLVLKCITMLALTWMSAVVVMAAPSTSHAVSDNTVNHAAWPPMKHHNIWSDDIEDFKTSEEKEEGADNYLEIYADHNRGVEQTNDETLRDFHWNFYSLMNATNTSTNYTTNITFKRKPKVIHLFPVPVDGECLSDDGRRTGICFNAYECRNKGGQAKGECAHGFGVCCIFIANCNETISNNITYLISPSFPSFMPNNVTSCNIKIKLMNDDISQLRIDFYHFILGQPNRRTGFCDGDIFNITGGPGGTFSLCGQNSGQHVYYDVGGRMLPRQTLYGSLRPLRYEDLYPGRNVTNDTTMEIDIGFYFTQRFLPTRLWEIRIAQIPFSQRAPAGCLQYFTGIEGVFQTFNFADNGRHLANQNYRICMRQELEMCSIVYQPCDEQSFRIGPSSSMNNILNSIGSSGGLGGSGSTGDVSGGAAGASMDDVVSMNQIQMQLLSDDISPAIQMNMTINGVSTTAMASTDSSTEVTSSQTTSPITSTTILSTTSTATSESTTASVPFVADDPVESTTVPISSTTDTTSTTNPTLSDDAEGSGGDEDGDTRFRPTPSNVSRRPRPTRGGFDLFGFLRSAFEFRFRESRQGKYLSERQKRQFYSNCRDRITMPCIVEDFIGTGLGPLPGCEPVHCGMQFCSNGMWPCRIESTVTPFYVGIHFGDGVGKGSAEDNIGACLRYQQMQCM